MSDTRTNEQIMQDLAQRAAAAAVETIRTEQGEPIDEAKVREWVASWVGDLKADDPLLRKIRFGGEAPPELIASKFHRFGLDTGDIEWLYDMQSSLRGQSRKGGGVYLGPSEDLQKAFDAVSDAYYVPQEEVRRIDRAAIDDMYPRVLKTRRERQEKADAIRAMDTAESGYGSQLIGAQYVGDLWEQARNTSRVFPLIDTFEMMAPTAYLPVEVDFPEMLFVSESVANNSANYATVKTGSNRVSVSAKKFVIHQMWSGEMEEDSIIPFVPFLRRQAALSVGFYSDSLVLNGDDTNAGTGNINLDDADPADTKHYLAFDGIRHAAIVDNVNNKVDFASGPDLKKLGALRGLMLDVGNVADWGHPSDPNDLVYVVDPKSADALQALDEVINWKTWNNRDALLTGQVGAILGHPVISTPAMPFTEADGKSSTTGSNNTKGQILAFNRRGCKVGWRRRVQVETERLPASDQTRIVYSMRLGMGRFTPTGAASGIEWAAVGYNVTV